MTLTEELRKSRKRLVWLFEMEMGRRLDEESWDKIPDSLFVLDPGNNNANGIREWSAEDYSCRQYDHVLDSFNILYFTHAQGKLFLANRNVSDHIRVYDITDLSLITTFGSTGSGDDEFDDPTGICTDEEYLYISDRGNHRIKKHRVDDYSFVAEIGSGPGTGDNLFNNPVVMCIDENNEFIYIAQNSGATTRLFKRRASDLSHVVRILDDGYLNGRTISGLMAYNGILYVVNASSGTSPNNFGWKYDCSDLSWISNIMDGSQGSGNEQWNSPYNLRRYGSHVFVADTDNDRIKRVLLSDFSYVSQYGKDISTDLCEEFDTPRDVELIVWYVYYLTLTDGRLPLGVRGMNRATGEMALFEEFNTIVDVNENPGSWMYEGGVLYVHTLGGDAPDNGSNYIEVLYGLYFCDSQYPDPYEIVFNGNWYDPRLDFGSIPEVTLETGGFEEGGLKATWGSVSILNADAFYDQLIYTYKWEANRCWLKVGRLGDPYSEYKKIYQGWTGSIEWDDEMIQIGILDSVMHED